ncbi:hypothetical protein ABF162_07530 [Vibrio coralliilyticus]|uniref:hypothetical protein n=1 Tax=Vibrio coralliilyticus TaxID=190893 RepID=UPI00052A1B03|nr:hypothetical protein [Vibrio coralliilyticus]AIU66875.1 hypothetical protein JV59_31515 [Vibrio coralliilyticus]
MSIITNHEEWRTIVTNISVSFDIYSAAGIFSTHNELERAYGDERAFGILNLVSSNLRSKKNDMRESELVMTLQSDKLRRAIRRNKNKGLRIQLRAKRIRKQDEAPVMGADSSPKKCVKCKIEFHCEGEICESCSVSEIWG